MSEKVWYVVDRDRIFLSPPGIEPETPAGWKKPILKFAEPGVQFSRVVWEHYFETREEAVEFIISQKEKQILSAERKIAKLNKEIKALKSSIEAKGEV